LNDNGGRTDQKERKEGTAVKSIGWFVLHSGVSAIPTTVPCDWYGDTLSKTWQEVVLKDLRRGGELLKRNVTGAWREMGASEAA